MTPLNKPLTGAKMDEQTLKALNESIEHWGRLATGDRKLGETIGLDDCALCNMFCERDRCAGCPVSEKTGQPRCWNTPYHHAYLARITHGLDSDQFMAAAAKELSFLESLLPQPE